VVFMGKKFYVVQEAEIVDPTVRKNFADCLDSKDIHQSAEGERYNFVGFIFTNDKMLISFPKRMFGSVKRKYLEENVASLKKYMRLLFKCIVKASSQKGEKFAGIRQELASSFPFTDFLEIYKYYITYGLYSKEREIKKFGYAGTISWKDTILRSQKIITEGNLLFQPLVIREDIREHVFISKCMAYAIDSTLDQFSFFLEGRKTGLDIKDIDFQNRNNVIKKLKRAKTSAFKDADKRLIHALISFFESIDPRGGIFQLKIYSFHVVWEDMVRHYLTRFFKGINDRNEMEFSDEARKNEFKKRIFHPDIRGEAGYALEPDFYWYLKDKNIRYIFDAKYYHKIEELDHKQISYYFLLKHYGLDKNNPGQVTDQPKTYNALILPSEGENESIVHFRLNPFFNRDENDFEIIEQYLNMEKVMEYYFK